MDGVRCGSVLGAQERDQVIGTLGQYEETAIAYRMQDGTPFVNATRICQANGKRWAAYWQNQQTQEFIAELARKLQCQDSDIVISQVGGDRSGTWVHKHVAIHLAQWCSAKFAVWVCEQIDNILSGQQVAHREHAEASLAMSIGEAIALSFSEAIAPAMTKLSDSVCQLRVEYRGDMAEVKQDIAELKKNDLSRRKNFSKSAEHAAIWCLSDKYNRHGKIVCPCCDRVLPRSKCELHHWRGKGGNSPTILFPLHPDCHKKAKIDPAWHDEKESHFRVFQEHAKPYFQNARVLPKEKQLVTVQQNLFSVGVA